MARWREPEAAEDRRPGDAGRATRDPLDPETLVDELMALAEWLRDRGRAAETPEDPR